MIHQLSIKKHRKASAWLLLFVFYMQLVFPALAHTKERTYPYYLLHANHLSNNINRALENALAPFVFLPKTSFKKEETCYSIEELKKERKNPEIKAVEGPGPGQPEMNSFQSVNTSNMVDLFTGDFSYNIPLLDVGGYPVNIHYTGGISMDQEASWVGLGWNINPGSISRNMRGIPDDFNGRDSISRTQYIKPNRTAGVTVGGDVEIKGKPLKVGASLGVFKNNYNGWGVETGINASINSGDKSSGALSGNLSLSNNSQTGLNVSPSISVNLGQQEQKLHGKSSLSTNFNSRTGISALQLNTQVRANYDTDKKLGNAIHAAVGNIPVTSSISFAVPSYTPTIHMPYTSTQYALTIKVGLEKPPLVHPSIYASGYVSQQEIIYADVHQSLPAVGYLYYSLSNNQQNALLDVNREKEIHFNVRTSPVIAIPQYTYDTYTITGEGTGGMFRPYRGEIGYVKDHSMRTKSASYNGSVDLGFGSLFHFGTDFIPVNSTTKTSGWENHANNAINTYIKFQKSDSTFQEVYFRNPGEKTSNTQDYYRSVGDDTLMRIKLGGDISNTIALNKFTLVRNAKVVGEIPVNSAPVKVQRDKRTQVINYLTAREATLYGLDKSIKSYKENSIPLGNCTDTVNILPRIDVLRKGHHLSEISVINADGRRYVYGLPAYNVEQKDVTFSVAKEKNADNISNGIVTYTPGIDNSINNRQGKENYYTQDSMPGYAHDFLLTGVLSPDYVDVTGDGITPDDLGDAVKFNYTRAYGPDKNYFAWRAPYQENSANYNEGLKTDNRDDKGTYIYGKKEVWYLNSIESKTMIAVFTISNNRPDAEAVKGENGGYDSSKKLRRLEKIDLYTKADLVASGTEAKPVKTVHFIYSYRLCAGINKDVPSLAKLTLDSIWFSYNGNDKGKINPYVFRYSPGLDGNPKTENNPSYNSKNYDRWGNYKNSQSNPDGLSNVDFPYSIQDSTIASQYASAWELTDIRLPSSGRIKITYEADDYAYVQNKRAAQFFQIAGFGSTPSSVPGNQLYPSFVFNSSPANYYYLFVNTDFPLSNTGDLRRKFLGNNDTVYFKIAVQMPEDIWGSGYELVPGYGVAAEIGISPSNSRQFWIRFQPVDGESPITRAALQFLRLNLGSKAYPGSEVGNDLDFAAAIKMLTSGFREIKNVINGFDSEAKKKGACQIADLTKSFVRLTNPYYKKYGGGKRVKRIELFDNWNKMTGQKEASYGQEYFYTTTEEVNGQALTISSGVASYEPAIGNDENPFRQPIGYAEKLAPLAPVNYLFVEQPVGESFYPSASVGYSKVTVRTINRKAKSANGWEQTSFYTTKDFPTLIEYTVLDDHSKKRFNPRLNNLLKINAKNYLTLTQGFKVELNDMNGKMKSQVSYPETDSLHPIRAAYYYYKEENPRASQKRLSNTVSIMDSIGGRINPAGIIGKDIEVMVDLREQSSTTISQQISPNIDIIPFPFLVPFLIIPAKVPLPQREETRFRSVATVKIIHRFGILDSVILIDKGSVVSTKNIVYDSETGEVIVSRTNNEFNDPVYNFNYPAYWAYSGMGPAYQNIGTVFYNKNLLCINGKLFHAHDRSDFPAKRFFESGDELWVHSTGHLPPDPGCIILKPDLSRASKKLWVMDAAKGKENGQGLYLIDKDGVPYSGMIDSLKIIRSGKRNMIQANAGSLVSLVNPVREINPGQFKIVIDENTQVIHSTAIAFNDLWRVENTMYQKDTIIKVYKTYTVNPVINATTLTHLVLGTGLEDRENTKKITINSQNIGASFEGVRSVKCRYFGSTARVNLHSKTIVNFDTSSIPAGATILSATLTLSPRIPRDLWNKMNINRGCDGNKKYISYDWSKATDYYKGASLAKLSRITAPYNNNTHYKSFQTTNKNHVKLDYNNYTSLNCTSLIQDMVDQKRSVNHFSMMFELDKNKIGLNFLNFCARNQQNSNCTQTSSQTLNPVASVSNSSIPCDCKAPQLTISYRVLEDTTIQVCRPNISDTATNPYRWGILGNWRMDKTYTYYSNTKERDASSLETNIRIEGALESFSPFWEMTDHILSEKPDTSKWVWNSSFSLYNRKGFEIENYDPLGRFNSALYGYNETLPKAVSQNSKYRQILFDGFEDYGYQSSNCSTCPSPREFDFVTNNDQVSISDKQSHTGLYSLKVNSGTQSRLSIPVIHDSVNAATSQLSFSIDTTAIYDTTIIGKGTGITGSYFGRSGYNCGTNNTTTRLDPFIDFDWGSTPPFSTLCSSRYTVTWKGFIQAPSTDNYTFSGQTGFLSFLSMQITVEGSTLSFNGNLNGLRTSPIPLVKGRLYPVTIQYSYFSLFNANSQVRFFWANNTVPTEIVPTRFLYPQNTTASDTAGSVVTSVKKYCVTAKNVTQSNLIRPAFSPVQGDSLVLTAWVRIDAIDCHTRPSLLDVIQVSFDKGNNNNTVYLQPTGVKIEGWQRYESVVHVPVRKKLTEMHLSLIAPAGSNIFVDDIRIQPFNSNTKSFVYNPINLRLMAALDENNYATFYEYDDDGTLIRIKKETEQGIMTIQETRSALTKEN